MYGVRRCFRWLCSRNGGSEEYGVSGIMEDWQYHHVRLVSTWGLHNGWAWCSDGWLSDKCFISSYVNEFTKNWAHFPSKSFSIIQNLVRICGLNHHRVTKTVNKLFQMVSRDVQNLGNAVERLIPNNTNTAHNLSYFIMNCLLLSSRELNFFKNFLG